MESSRLQKTARKPQGKHIYFSILRGGLLGCISQKREEKKKGNTHIFNSVSETDNNCRIQEKHSETPYCDKTLSWERVCRALMHLFKSAIQWLWAVFYKNVACSAPRATNSRELCMKPSGLSSEAPQIPYQVSQRPKERVHYHRVKGKNTNAHIYFPYLIFHRFVPAKLSRDYSGKHESTLVLIFHRYWPPGSPSQAIDAFGFTAHRRDVSSPFVLASFLLAYDRRTGFCYSPWTEVDTTSL